jgi:mRNA interferase MazF
MRKGAIVLVAFPFTDLSGHKVRPALVLYASERGEDCIVAFVSSVAGKSRSLFSIPLTPTKVNGLKTASVLKVDKLATLEKKLVLGELGTLEPATLTLVNKKLKTLFAI